MKLFEFQQCIIPSIDVIAIDSTLRPTNVNIFMGHLEYRIILGFNLSFKYADDCFIISDSEKLVLCYLKK